MIAMRPPRGGIKPMMVRSRTDFPPPDAPTRPRISPRRTSSESPSSTFFVPNPTVRSRAEIAGVWDISCMALHPDRREKDREQAVENNDQKNRLHDRGRCLRSQRLGASLDAEPLA